MSDCQKELVIFEEINNNNLYVKLINQFNKDFVYSGLSTSFAQNLNPKDLVQYLVGLIEDLIRNRFSDYLNLLYRIDIAETEIKRLDGSDIHKLSEQVAVLILKRECQKVLFKSKL